jgi:sugar lactone lactonase YvrE
VIGRLFAALVVMLAAAVPAVADEPVTAPPPPPPPWKLINDKSFYPESPLWYGDKLYYVEYAAHAVVTWDGRENRQIWKQDGCGPSGLTLFRNGFLVACYDSNSLVLIDGAGNITLKIDKDAGGQPLKGPNDFADDGKGGLYVSMSGAYDVAAPIEGKIYHLDAAGTLTRVADDIHYANGMALAEGGRTLLVAEMLAQRVLRIEVKPDGTLGQRWVFLRMRDIVPDPEGADGYYGPDGLKVGPDGNVYIAQNGGGAVLVVDPTGKKLLRRLPVGSKYVTNLGLGPGGNPVYVTAATDPWKAPFPGEVYEVQNR